MNKQKPIPKCKDHPWNRALLRPRSGCRVCMDRWVERHRQTLKPLDFWLWHETNFGRLSCSYSNEILSGRGVADQWIKLVNQDVFPKGLGRTT